VKTRSEGLGLRRVSDGNVALRHRKRGASRRAAWRIANFWASANCRLSFRRATPSLLPARAARALRCVRALGSAASGMPFIKASSARRVVPEGGNERCCAACSRASGEKKK
jgi:hypothetical protein